MKRFKVINNKIHFMDKFGERKFNTIHVTIHNPPYENENILYKTKWNAKDCIITDITPKFQGEE